jgi:hypothetical protein
MYWLGLLGVLILCGVVAVEWVRLGLWFIEWFEEM